MPFLTGYTKRKKITIDNTYVDSDLTNFPLLVKFTNDADIGADIDSNGYNIRFTSSDGETLLKYDRQSFSVNGTPAATGVFWVKVPTVAGAADTDIYVYYKAASPSDGQDATNVWDSNFGSVHHAEEDPSGSQPAILDSTSNNRDGTASNMESGDLVAAKVGYGLDFDGVSEHVSLGRYAALEGASAVTVSAVVKWEGSAPAESKTIIRKQAPNGTDICCVLGIGWDAAKNKARFYVIGSVGSYANSGDCTTNVADGTFHHVAGTFDGSTVKIYVDGALENSKSYSGTLGTAQDDLLIGAWLSNTGYRELWDGVIEEHRVSLVARSADWIKFEYRNIFEADNEIAFAAEESDGGGVTGSPWNYYAQQAA